MRHGSLFSGIGGFDLAAQWMGWENVFHCEWNDFSQKILKHYWPKAISYGDIKRTDFTIHRGKIDILTGGFPCQPYSMAGKRLGKEDDRHLWPEMLRAIREIKPTWVVGENVYGLINWSGGLVFNEVQADLEAEGYTVQPVILPACAVNAPHRRDRIWFIATNSNHDRTSGESRSNEGTSGTERVQEWNEIQQFEKSDTIRPTCKCNVSNSNECAERPPRKSGEIESDRSNNNDEQGSRGKQTKQYCRCSNVLRPNTNATSQQSECLQPEQRETGKQEQGKLGGNGSEMGNWRNDTNTECIGQSRPWRAEQQSNTRPNEQWKASWAYNDGRWPTESPICGRNDGLSERLAGITLSNFRGESIKAYGNAIVPQVVYQIFKTIELVGA